MKNQIIPLQTLSLSSGQTSIYCHINGALRDLNYVVDKCSWTTIYIKPVS